MLNVDWLGVPRLQTLQTIGARSIKPWHALGTPSHFLKFIGPKIWNGLPNDLPSAQQHKNL